MTRYPETHGTVLFFTEKGDKNRHLLELMGKMAGDDAIFAKTETEMPGVLAINVPTDVNSIKKTAHCDFPDDKDDNDTPEFPEVFFGGLLGWTINKTSNNLCGGLLDHKKKVDSGGKTFFGGLIGTNAGGLLEAGDLLDAKCGGLI